MKKILFCLGLIIFIGGCKPKRLIYFQEDEKSKSKFVIKKPLESNLHIITPGDVITINVTTLTKTAFEEFLPTKTYQVKQDGSINLPFLKDVYLKGLNMIEGAAVLQKKLSTFLENPDVKLELVSFQVIIMGEVSNPGIKTIMGDKVTIIEALSLGGDLGIYGSRKNIKIIRTQPDNRITTHFVNINSLSIFESEVFYLQSNDIFYVEPRGMKLLGQNLQFITLTFSVVNLFFLIIRLV